MTAFNRKESDVRANLFNMQGHPVPEKARRGIDTITASGVQNHSRKRSDIWNEMSFRRKARGRSAFGREYLLHTESICKAKSPRSKSKAFRSFN
mmetsp:Transcript_3312/g.6463  ORF Transcript_3312/g.6463 Transcript_3312/m.6463 type:complete len:94 (-) Transcript_3312:1690-1971(-)